MKIAQTASIAFEDVWQHESIALFAPDNGRILIEQAKNFCKNLENLKSIDISSLTSNEAMFKFCMWLANPPFMEEMFDEAAPHDYYFGMDGEDGDNSILGHHVIKLLTGQETMKQNIYD